MSALRFMRLLLGTSAAFAAAVYVFIVVLDPYQDVPFAPVLTRAPVSTNQRFAYPALARDPLFDSAIIGDSTVRLLDPERLGAATGARFVTLAMNSATAYEQSRVHGLFAAGHRAARYLVVGIDGVWCQREASADYTFRAFPEWMYDDNRWNDLWYLFNDKALEDAVRMLELVNGRRAPRYRRDGYADFTRGFGAYSRARAEHRIYGGPVYPYAKHAALPQTAHPDWHYPQLDVLAAMLARHSPATRIALVFVPLHAHFLASSADNFAECKGRVVQRFGGATTIALLDYMYASPLTTTDSNYWDNLHYTAAVARLLESDIAAALGARPPSSGFVRQLALPAAPAGGL